jgi:hypothetical protein
MPEALKEQFVARCTKAEIVAARRAAKRAGTSLGAFIRCAVAERIAGQATDRG